ncbi:MAG: LysR family transcriptional regulator [Rubrivivax sp.]|nr:MAG: LysR family transcriptional regulator [Rubrivivax sp.]
MHASVLKYFVEVARSGSVRKASEHLFVAASAVNRQILKLEDELGVELFDRLPNGLRLNPAGERLLRHAQETLHAFGVMRAELDALKGERTGHVKLAAMDSFFEEFLPAAVDEFLQTFPAVTYTLTATQPMDVASLVASGQMDVGLAFVNRLPAGASAVALSHLPLGIVMPPGHPLAASERVSLKECAQYPFLRSSMHPVVSSTLSHEFTDFWDAMEPAATCNSTPMIKRLIRAGKGISCFSKIAFIQELTRGELLWRPFDLPELDQIQVGIIVPSQRVLPHVTQNFVGRLARRLSQLELTAASLY